MNNSDTVLERLASRATQLYSLPVVAMKVLELTGNPHVDTHALKACIENDPALTGKILRVVNSSLFGLSREVSDLNQALALLGIKPLKMLVLGFSLPPALFAQMEGGVLERYWRHTLTKAVAGREISEWLWEIPGDDAFVAGLLQDLGELLLIQEIGEPYCRLLHKVEDGHFDLATIEAETMGFDHTALSARLLAGWRLPAVLAESVSWGEGLRPADGATDGRSPLQQILHLAELLASFLADGRPEALAELLIIGRHYRDFSDAQLEQLVDSLEHKVRNLADVLSLDLPDGLNYSDVLLRAHGQLSAVAESVAADMVVEPGAAAEQSLLSELEDLTDAVAQYRTERPAPPTPAAAVSTPVLAGCGAGPGSTLVAAMPAGRPPAPLAAPRSGGSVGPGNALMEHLTAAGRACRDARCPLSLLLLQLEPPAEESFGPGTAGYELLLRELERGCRRLGHDGAVCRPDVPGGFALILPDCERRQAVEYGNQLASQWRRWVRETPWTGQAPEAVLSAGAATIGLPPRNFSPADMIDAAARCAYASRASGGVVKSIEIY